MLVMLTAYLLLNDYQHQHLNLSCKSYLIRFGYQYMQKQLLVVDCLQPLYQLIVSRNLHLPPLYAIHWVRSSFAKTDLTKVTDYSPSWAHKFGQAEFKL